MIVIKIKIKKEWYKLHIKTVNLKKDYQQLKRKVKI